MRRKEAKTVQLNMRITPTMMRKLNALANVKGWGQIDVIEFAIESLTEIEAKRARQAAETTWDWLVSEARQ